MATQPRNSRTRSDYSTLEGQRPATQIPPARPLTPGEFNTALVHLYRGEVSRANTWRIRLDGTTNWAVLTTGATLSFAFSSAEHTHVMILLNSLLIGFFLFIEARRYRYYDLWRTRVRLMETEFFADLLVPNSTEIAEEHWREMLATDLLQPNFTIGLWEALGRRLRRNYSWIFAVLVLSWIVKVGIHPFPTMDINELLRRAAVGPISGITLIVIGVIFNGLLITLALATSARFSRLHFRGEVRSRSQNRKHMVEAERNWWE